MLIIILIVIVGIIVYYTTKKKREVPEIFSSFKLPPLEKSILYDLHRLYPQESLHRLLYRLCLKPISNVNRKAIASKIIFSFHTDTTEYDTLRRILAPRISRPTLTRAPTRMRRPSVTRAPSPPRMPPPSPPRSPSPSPLPRRPHEEFGLQRINITEQIREFQRLEQSHKKSRPKHMYNSKENVHIINSDTLKVAAQLVDDYYTDDADVQREYSILLLNCPSSVVRNVSGAIQRIQESTTKYGYGKAFTLSKLLLSVVSYIEQSKDKIELYKRLYEELADMDKKCSTGYIVRLINVLRGFSDKYEVNLPVKDQIYARLSILIENDLKTNEDIVADPSLINEYVIKEKERYIKDLLQEYPSETKEVDNAIYKYLNIQK